MQIGMINRNNIGLYTDMISKMSGGKKANNPFEDAKALDITKKNTPINFIAPTPNWNKIPTKSNAPKKSDAELTEEIKDLARRTFVSKKHNRKEYNDLKRQFLSKASPDRKKIFEDNKKTLGGKMNGALAYFSSENEPVLLYHTEGHYLPITTDAEWGRNREFNNIYNGELSRLESKYGEKKVDFETIKRERSEESTISYQSGSFDMKI